MNIVVFVYGIMILRHPRSTRTVPLVPYTALFRSVHHRRVPGVGRYGAAELDRGRLLQQGSPDGHQRQFSAAIQLYRPLRSIVELQHVALYQPERRAIWRSEEHTSELQSLMRISYAVFCLKTKNYKARTTTEQSRRNTTDSQNI